MADRLTAEQLRAAFARLRRIIMDRKPYAAVLVVPDGRRAAAVNRRRLSVIGQRTHEPDRRGEHRG